MRSAYALQKTSFFVLFTNKPSFCGGIYGAIFFQKKSGHTHGRTQLKACTARPTEGGVVTKIKYWGRVLEAYRVDLYIISDFVRRKF